MKPLETMTEYQVLLYAYYHVLDMWLKESEILKRRPESAIAKARFESVNARYEELRSRLIELEKAQKN